VRLACLYSDHSWLYAFNTEILKVHAYK